MKEIKAYVRPERAVDVIQALEKVGIHGMTVIDVTALAEWADPRRTRFSST
ncbi:MAG: P-II family nitrogen regulator, partial [Candidatus Neomarinimicrobiota bacterium]